MKPDEEGEPRGASCSSSASSSSGWGCGDDIGDRSSGKERSPFLKGAVTAAVFNGPIQDRSPKDGEAARSGKQFIRLPGYIPLQVGLQVPIPRMHEKQQGKPKGQGWGRKINFEQGEDLGAFGQESRGEEEREPTGVHRKERKEDQGDDEPR
jgi:hypothetical protein